MLKINWKCSSCNSSGQLIDRYELENLTGICPNCYKHNGEVSYKCTMTKDEFIEEISKMTERDLIINYEALHLCALSLLNKR